MRISRIKINNFRNFEEFDVAVGESAVIVGENGVGKSNLIHALRLILDPTLADSARQLRNEDFWDGLPRPLTADDRIEISLEFSDFDNDADQLAVLGQYLVESNPMVARLTYVFQSREDLEGAPTKESDYEFHIFGGNRPENRIGYDVRKSIPLDLMPALRDAESDLARWNKSPLRPLLQNAASQINRADLEDLALAVYEATMKVAEQRQISDLGELISAELTQMAGKSHATDVKFGFGPSDPDRLIRSLRLLLDDGKLGVGDASLGMANVLYLTLTAMEITRRIDDEDRIHTFLAIEEPEAHLHPHLQRRVFRHFLKTRQQKDEDIFPATVLLSTHSPHIVSITPARSLILLRYNSAGTATEGVSTANLEMSDHEIYDIERYLDVSRGEVVFARGVILVEGDAEQFIVPALATCLGYDLDSLGISICSVSGTHFDSYVKFLGSTGLAIPFALITDEDPVEADDETASLGFRRIRRLLELIIPDEWVEDSDVLELGEENGIFMTDYTLEVALFKSGSMVTFEAAMKDLSENAAAKKRATGWRQNPATLNEVQMLKDIAEVGKGRFAQRWASRILTAKPITFCPDSVRKALDYVIAEINR